MKLRHIIVLKFQVSIHNITNEFGFISFPL